MFFGCKQHSIKYSLKEKLKNHIIFSFLQTIYNLLLPIMYSPHSDQVKVDVESRNCLICWTKIVK